MDIKKTVKALLDSAIEFHADPKSRLNEAKFICLLKNGTEVSLKIDGHKSKVIVDGQVMAEGEIESKIKEEIEARILVTQSELEHQAVSAFKKAIGYKDARPKMIPKPKPESKPKKKPATKKEYKK